MLFQGLAIGPDNFEMSQRLTEASFKIVQEMHRPGILFYNPETRLYYSFKNSITVDKKEGNQLTVIGGGSYMTKFFDIYTDDNQETKGIPTWRQCDRCFLKGNIKYDLKILKYFVVVAHNQVCEFFISKDVVFLVNVGIAFHTTPTISTATLNCVKHSAALIEILKYKLL